MIEASTASGETSSRFPIADPPGVPRRAIRLRFWQESDELVEPTRVGAV